MEERGADSAPGQSGTQWTLIRGARQLLTLRGAHGPRRRSDLNNLSILADGAVLIRNGVIHEIGTTRRVENMEAARCAREIDAAGRIVMPGFVDPDFALASSASPAEPDIRRMSRARLESRAASLAYDAVRYGITTIGANTLAAPDLPNTLRALRIYRKMNFRPARLRVIASPAWKAGARDCAAAISRRHFAPLFQIDTSHVDLREASDLARAAASAGCEIRLRVEQPVSHPVPEFTAATGCTSLISSAIDTFAPELPFVQVATGSALFTPRCSSLRSFVDDGGAPALATGYQCGAMTSMNPQHLLFSACREAGLTLEEAITAMTHNAACALGVAREAGSLMPGRPADICILDVRDYRELAGRPGHHDVWMVLCAGRVVYRRPAPPLQ